MRNTHRCPKCGGTEIITVEPGLYNSFPVGFVTQAKLERWVCCTCGFSEEWVEQDKLDKVREYYRQQADGERTDGWN